MGRRSYSPDKRRRNSLQAYLTDKEYERVYHVAIKQDLHISAWMRSIILREVTEEEVKNG